MRTTAADVIREVAIKHRIPVAAILGQCRRREYSVPRQEAMFRIYTECLHMSYPATGKRLGGRDHTTVIHGVKAHCQRNGICYETAMKNRREAKAVPHFSRMMNAYAESLEAARG